ncbi:hypothetical protein M8J75_010907 [Diaphorina citri]|nr:hypothetical protein M8J75_010907 [Diaphorina citri]
MYYAGGEDKKSEEKKSEKEIVYATSREMKAYFQKMMEKMGEIAAKLEGALEENKKLRKDAERRDKEINNLQMKVELLEQRTRINNLEIVNLPVTPNENPVEIVKSLAQCVGVEIRDEDIQAVHRVPRYDKKGKNMVVQFCSRWKKNIILQACADFRKRNNNKINFKYVKTAHGAWENEIQRQPSLLFLACVNVALPNHMSFLRPPTACISYEERVPMERFWE